MQELNQTKMTAPDASKIKMIKVKAILDFSKSNGEIIKEGTVTTVTEQEAEYLCDKVFEGAYAFSGERHLSDGDAKKHQIKRAVRI